MNIGRHLKYLLVSIVLAMGSGVAWASSLQLNQLAGFFKTKTQSKLSFVQRRYFQFSERPVISSGYLYFKAPDYLAQITVKPQAQTVIATGGYLMVVKNNKIISQSSLKTSPNLMVLMSMLKQILKGDVKQLHDYFTVKISGTKQNWILSLVPKKSGFGNISTVQLNGHYGYIDAIAVHYSTGDLLTLILAGSS